MLAVSSHARAAHSGATDGLGARPRATNTAWRRFRRNWLAVGGLSVLIFFCLVAIFAGTIARQSPYTVDLDHMTAPPGNGHLLGTDAAGRDVFAWLVYGARVSMSVALVAVGISGVIGTLVGFLAGYLGGWVDGLLMRFTELAMTFPTFFAVIILVSLIGPNVGNVMLVIGVLGWTELARLVRGQVLALRAIDYVVAARALGASDRRILSRHILPGTLSYIMVATTLGRGNFAYSVAMAGVIQMTRELSTEWSGRGIRINAIAPAQITNPAFEARMDATPQPSRNDPPGNPHGAAGATHRDRRSRALLSIGCVVVHHRRGHPPRRREPREECWWHAPRDGGTRLPNVKTPLCNSNEAGGAATLAHAARPEPPPGGATQTGGQAPVMRRLAQPTGAIAGVPMSIMLD